jgi:hypothetical protein
MSWAQIRRTGGLDDIVKAMIEQQQRLEAERGVEDVNDLEQARVDFDSIAYADSYTATLNGTESDTDAIAYADVDEPSSRGRIFRLAGGDAITFAISNAPSSMKQKTGDTFSKVGCFGSASEAAVIGHCVIGGP